MVESFYSQDPGRQNVHILQGMMQRVNLFVDGLIALGFDEIVVIRSPASEDAGPNPPPIPYSFSFACQDVLLVDAFVATKNRNVWLYAASSRPDSLKMMLSLLKLKPEAVLLSKSLDVWLLEDHVPPMERRVYFDFRIDSPDTEPPHGSVTLFRGHRNVPQLQHKQYYGDTVKAFKGEQCIDESSTDRADWLTLLTRGSPYREDTNRVQMSKTLDFAITKTNEGRKVLILPNSDRSPSFTNHRINAWGIAEPFIMGLMQEKREDLSVLEIQYQHMESTREFVGSIDKRYSTVHESPLSLHSIVSVMREHDDPRAWYPQRDMARCTIAATVCLGIETSFAHNPFNLHHPGVFLKNVFNALTITPLWMVTGEEFNPMVNVCKTCKDEFAYYQKKRIEDEQPRAASSRADWKLVTKNGNVPCDGFSFQQAEQRHQNKHRDYIPVWCASCTRRHNETLRLNSASHSFS